MLAMRFDLLPAGLLRRAVQAAQPGPAVLLRRGSDDRARGAGRAPGGGLRVVRAASPLPPPRSARSIGRSSTPESGSPSRSSVPASARPPAGHRPDVRGERHHRPDAPVRGDAQSRQVIDEFARWTADELDYLVEARQAALLHEHAVGERLERIARVYRDYTTSRVLTSELIEGIPLYEVMIAVARRRRRLPRVAPGARLRPRQDRAQPRLEHAQPGVSSTATSTRTFTRRTCSCCRATRSATWTTGSWAAPERRTRFPDPLQLAAVPWRRRGRHRRS